MQKITTQWNSPPSRPPASTLTMPELHAPELFSATETPSATPPTATPETCGVASSTLTVMAALPLMLLAALTLLCTFTPLDVWVSQQFYQHDAFPYYQSPLANFLYDFGPWPGIVFGIGSIVLLLTGFLVSALSRWQKATLFLTLAVLVGPVVVINGILKPGWDRPRPVSIVEFGGRHEYVGPASFGAHEKGRSFPSGHASMGFVFMLPAFLLLRSRPRAAAAVFALGLMLGGGIGLSRIAEGGHFLSDIAWSGAIVYFTGLALYVGMGLHRGTRPQQIGAHAATVPFSRGQQGPANSDKARSNSAA